ncbi:MAG: hypothetical protein PHN86_04700 [Proteiniphilum sp.]|nr:hypothetical protein [Proteiniphilum sp.]
MRSKVVIAGRTDKLEGHTLGEITLLSEYMLFAKVIIASDWRVFTPGN